jgi:diguanylate cyclase (GGDEF)-like protein
MYLAGAAIGIVALAVPHGARFNALADLLISAFATAVGIWAWRRERLTARQTSLLLLAGTLAVSGGVYSGRGDYVSVSAAVIYIWLALLASLFLSAGRTLAHLVAIAAAYGVVLGLAGNSGAPAEWLFIIVTASVTALVTFAIRKDLLDLTERDPLTGLLNRAGLDRVLETEISRAAKEGTLLTIVVLDLDGFKTLNDERGHLEGDRALIASARAWVEALRDGAVLARFGGDEFVLVLPGADEHEASAMIEQMRLSAQANPFSAGIAMWKPSETPAHLLARADAALYRAKASRVLDPSGSPAATVPR